MSCVHVFVVTLILAAAGPATAMPPALATSLVGVALLALCAPVPAAITVGLAVGSGLLLEYAFSARMTDPDLLDSASRICVLTVLALGMAAFRFHRGRPRAAGLSAVRDGSSTARTP